MCALQWIYWSSSGAESSRLLPTIAKYTRLHNWIEWMSNFFFYFFTHLTTLLHKSISLLLTLGFYSCSHFSDNTIFLKAFFFLISRFSSPSSWARFASRATPSCWSPRRCSCRLFEFSFYFHCHFLWVISIGIFCKWNFVCMRNILRILPKSSCRSMSWKMCNRCKQTRVILEPSSSSVFAIQKGKKRQLSIQLQTSSSRRMEWNSIKSESVAKMRSILLSLSFHLCKGKRLFSVVHNKRMTSQRARSVTVTSCKLEHRCEFSDAHLAAHSLFRHLELSSSFPFLCCVNI